MIAQYPQAFSDESFEAEVLRIQQCLNRDCEECRMVRELRKRLRLPAWTRRCMDALRKKAA